MTVYDNVDPRGWGESQVIELDNGPETVLCFRTGTHGEYQLATLRLQTYDDMPSIYWVRIYEWDRPSNSLELMAEEEIGLHLPWPPQT